VSAGDALFSQLSSLECKRAATGEHEFDTLCTDLDIEHRLTPPKSPQTNGIPLVHLQCIAGQRVERFNGRIEEVLQSHDIRSGEELETTLHRYVWLYNQQLPQPALGSKPPLQAMKDWHNLRPELFKKQPYYFPGCDTPLANAIRYALTRMKRLRGYLDHGFLELDNNTAERSMRGIAIGRKNYMFVGSERGGKSAAIIYTLIETAKLNSVDPQA
jgi:hypothetical protein